MKDGWYRVRDVVASALGLAVLSPVLLAIGVAIRLDSDGPAYFRQVRVGQGGRPFRIHKFRTMTMGGTGPLVSTSTDARVTKVGAVLRRTKLDELPQLIDVLEGNMSLVGPRPEVPRFVARWPNDARRIILSVRPGVTDPTSVRYIDEGSLLAQAEDPELAYVQAVLPLKVASYLSYVAERTFTKDLGILVATVAALGRGR